ncbi:hypothetical protein Hdeb2414_s0149g00814391 [Helianthus debilis subsp. tardiflorus]
MERTIRKCSCTFNACSIQDIHEGPKTERENLVLNFLLFYNTLLGETTTNSSINMRFLPALRRGMDIRSFNWCEYMIRCLDRTVEAWTPKDCFLGPMPLLVEDERRVAHLIEDITQDDIKAVNIKLDTVRFDQMLVEAYDLHPEQRYPFAKMADEEVQAKEVKADEKDVTKKVKHNSKSNLVKSKKTVVKPAGRTHGKPTESDVLKKIKFKKNRRKPIRFGRRNLMLKVARKLRLLSKKFPLTQEKNAEFEEYMHVEVGPETVPVVDTSDIEKYYIETSEWGQTQQTQPGINIGFDGEIRIPMVS